MVVTLAVCKIVMICGSMLGFSGVRNAMEILPRRSDKQKKKQEGGHYQKNPSLAVGIALLWVQQRKLKLFRSWPPFVICGCRDNLWHFLGVVVVLAVPRNPPS
jgi:hypothetical protein